MRKIKIRIWVNPKQISTRSKRKLASAIAVTYIRFRFENIEKNFEFFQKDY